MKKTALSMVLVLAVFGGAAQAQTAAGAAPADPISATRVEQREATAKYNQAVKAARAERNAKVTAAVSAAVKDATAQGKDPATVKRDANAKAMAETKSEFDGKVKAAADARKAEQAAAKKKLADSGVRRELEKDKLKNPQGN